MNIRFAVGLLDLSRATYYRRSKPVISEPWEPPKTRLVPRALKPEEKEAIRSVVYSERFVDFSVYEIYFTLLDEGIFLASIRTIYWVLKEDESSAEGGVKVLHFYSALSKRILKFHWKFGPPFSVPSWNCKKREHREGPQSVLPASLPESDLLRC